MSIIKPFRAIRPTKELASKVAALPYDVMNSTEAREMVKGNEFSFLHVDKAEIDLDENINIYSKEVYEKARSNFQNMCKSGVFIQDEKPLFYIYRLTMNEKNQTGLVACTSIDEYLNGNIKKHELTRADKEQDRINHVDFLNANTGPIFLTYKANDNIIFIVDQWTKNNEPVYKFETEDDITHTCWVVDNETTIKALAGFFQQVECLYIADGHHRNASALKVGLKRREQNPNCGADAEFNFYLSVLFPDDELRIMDYNRVVKDLNGLTPDQFLNKLSENFDIEQKGNAVKPENPNTFGMYIAGRWFLLTAKNHLLSNDIIKKLDVSILQDNVLVNILGIGDIRTDKRIDFVGGIRGLDELEKRVNSGEMAVAFSMYPTSIKELMDIADNDLIMPPKSTWFEPKLRSGLFIHSLDN